jgi:hypothetical protein
VTADKTGVMLPAFGGALLDGGVFSDGAGDGDVDGCCDCWGTFCCCCCCCGGGGGGCCCCACCCCCCCCCCGGGGGCCSTRLCWERLLCLPSRGREGIIVANPKQDQTKRWTRMPPEAGLRGLVCSNTRKKVHTQLKREKQQQPVVPRGVRSSCSDETGKANPEARQIKQAKYHKERTGLDRTGFGLAEKRIPRMLNLVHAD